MTGGSEETLSPGGERDWGPEGSPAPGGAREASEPAASAPPARSVLRRRAQSRPPAPSRTCPPRTPPAPPPPRGLIFPAGPPVPAGPQRCPGLGSRPLLASGAAGVSAAGTNSVQGRAPGRDRPSSSVSPSEAPWRRARRLSLIRESFLKPQQSLYKIAPGSAPLRQGLGDPLRSVGTHGPRGDRGAAHGGCPARRPALRLWSLPGQQSGQPGGSVGGYPAVLSLV